MGLRYINEFTIPCKGGLFDRDEVVKYLPNTPHALNENPLAGIEGFLERVSYRTADSDRAVITTVNRPPKESDITFVLDIEVGRDGPWGVDSPEMWEVLDRLRNLKNQLFYSSTSEELRKGFQ